MCGCDFNYLCPICEGSSRDDDGCELREPLPVLDGAGDE